jgi:hypothetical protein
MISGMNTETEYLGKVYHIQTEDGGRQNPIITTQLFFKGAILFTQRTSYADIIKAEYVEAIVKDLMKQQHTQVIKDLLSGKLLEKKASQPPPAAKGTPAEAKSPLPQNQDKAKKSLDDLILDYLAGKKEKSDS